MTEEHAALLITEYANGLRSELALLGASEVNDLVSEVVAMLRDASAGDAGIAAVEIERLGPPAELARAVLEQHGFDSGPGLQAASWWRLGVAAPVDIAVGLAAPVAASVLVWRVLATFIAESVAGETSLVAGAAWGLLSCAIVGAALWLAWRYWRPWRVGGGEATAGMALAGIAVVTLGGTRSVVPTADLARSGLAHPHRSKPGSALTVLLSAGLLAWAVMAVGSPVSPGSDSVRTLAGHSSVQEAMVRAVVDRLYGVASGTDSQDTGAGSARTYIDPVLLDTSHLDTELARRARGGKLAYEIVSMRSPRPGTWTVDVAESGAGGTRKVTVNLSLRVEWTPDATPSWIISGYEPAGTP